MKNKKQVNMSKRIFNIITLAILLVLLYFAYDFYQTNNFNDFIKSETKLYTSQFKRDKENKYSKKRSYKISSPEYNDAMFYQKIKLEKNHPYKVTCMIKTENVESKNNNSGVGAQIAIEGSTERSVAVSGTKDWQKVELIFNSKNREELNIGFRLGGYLGEAKGDAWFSELTIEEGLENTDNEWDFACFIFENTDVTINNEQVQIQTTQSDIKDIEKTISRFEKSCSELSDRKMTANCDIYNIVEPLTKLSYDNEFAYYVAPEDVEAQIKDTIANNTYDHIFVIVKLRR